VLPEDLVFPFIFTLPAYVANPSAVLWGGGVPMDGGRVWRDGRRVLGDGKTWRGFFGGTLSGAVVGVLIALLAGGAAAGFGTLRLVPAFTAMALGALTGDAIGAFVKRRRGLARGAKAPILDQYDFLLGALLLLAVADPGLLVGLYLTGDRLYGFLLVILITWGLHRAVNVIGFRLGKKKEPW